MSTPKGFIALEGVRIRVDEIRSYERVTGNGRSKVRFTFRNGDRRDAEVFASDVDTAIAEASS